MAKSIPHQRPYLIQGGRSVKKVTILIRGLSVVYAVGWVWGVTTLLVGRGGEGLKNARGCVCVSEWGRGWEEVWGWTRALRLVGWLVDGMMGGGDDSLIMSFR